jgi:hypothetical protein
MPKVLFFATALVLFSFVFDSNLKASSGDITAQKIKYEYYVETDLETGKFSEAFCTRLSDKHNWQQVSAEVSTDETYTSIFSFKDESAHAWQCEVQIKKINTRPNRMYVEMTMTEVLES